MKDQFDRNNRLVQLYSLGVLEKIRDNFLAELNRAVEGKEVSLAFIRNPLPQKNVVEEEEVFQVLSVGGTHLESALAFFEKGRLSLYNIEKTKLTTLDNKQKTLSLLGCNIKPKVKTVALNFAYPLEPVVRENLLDGKLISGTKEHKLSGLVGRPVGKELEKYLEDKGRAIKVSCANDVICLALSGLEKAPWQNIVGGIVGTGTNFTFFLNSDTVVNLESAQFDKFPRSATGKAVDQKSSNPGTHLFEKELSGRYLFQHFNFLSKRGEIRRSLKSTRKLSMLAEKDDSLASRIAQRLLFRSASLIAAQAAGIYLFKKAQGVKKLNFVMEGSVFWKGYGYKLKVEEYLTKLGVSRAKFEFVQVERSSLVGAAQLLKRKG